MTYISLYRKYRPLTFDEVIGQEAVVQTLKNAIANNMLAHAYIFSGPRGTGKTSMARILAKALNCREGISLTPCLKCDLCLRIKDGEALDVFEIDAASNNGVDEIRDLREKIAFAPVEGKYKIYIIDEVHMLSISAFNALLKTIEEPPDNTLFVLATTEPNKIPVTILSRCQRLEFRRITLPKIVEMLKKIAKKEEIDIEEKALNLIAKNSEGGMRDAISMLDQILSFKGKQISVDSVLEVLGTTDISSVFKMGEYLVAGQTAAALQLLEEIIIAGKAVSYFTQNLLEYFRHLIMAKAGAYAAIDLTAEQIDLLKNQAAEYSLEDLKKIIAVLSKAESNMRWYPNIRLVLEIALVEISSLKEGGSLQFAEKSKVTKKDQKLVKEKVLNEIKNTPKEKNEKPIKPELQKKVEVEKAIANKKDENALGTLAEIKH
ncbi:MAG: DNA polymerase III subunit gamma/tau, partial [Candidatus Margulisbacteria bacterium]|nr:DNA polymerase III subunit gamma/tau [Candidatus Margulisiibacteriota bacterium]